MRLSKQLAAACEALDPKFGGKPTRVRRPTAPKKLAAGWSVELTLPCVVVSEMNRRDHWAVRRRRFDAQKATVHAVLTEAGLQGAEPTLPVVVDLIRVGGKFMDCDNLAGSFKAVRDAVAEWLCVDDGDPLVSWQYAQQGGGTPGVRVRVEGK